MRLIGRMFLDMLAQLDGLNLVGDATDVKSLGTIMAIYLKIASEVRSIGGILEEDDDDDKGGRKTKFQANHFDDAILSYANQRGVTLQGPGDIDEITANLKGEVKLPKKDAKDPWGFKAALKIYEKNYGKGKPHAIGGDDLDITTVCYTSESLFSPLPTVNANSYQSGLALSGRRRILTTRTR